MGDRISVVLSKRIHKLLSLSLGGFKGQKRLVTPNTARPPANPGEFFRDFFSYDLIITISLENIQQLSILSLFLLSLTHTCTYFLLKTRLSKTLCPHSSNSQEDFHMLLFWAVTMCICFDFRPPIGSCTSV